MDGSITFKRRSFFGVDIVKFKKRLSFVQSIHLQNTSVHMLQLDTFFEYLWVNSLDSMILEDIL